MLKLKTAALAVLALSNSVVFSGTIGPTCIPGSVTVPCPKPAWDFGAQVLYSQARIAGMEYEGINFDRATGSIVSNQSTLNWGWGFKLEGSYHFNTGSDLNLNWYHWNNEFNKTLNTYLVLDAIDPLGIRGNYPDDLKVHPGWDALNLEFGQLANFGEMHRIRFHGGVQYSRIVGTWTNTYNIPATALESAYIINSDRTLKFNGVGPRLGLDYSYHWFNSLAIYANGAAGLLVGTHSFKHSDQNPYFALSSPVTSFTWTGSSTALVPELEAKLGATYTYVLAHGQLSLDAGWMWINYFNAMQRAHDVAEGTFVGGTRESNFGIQGPYIGAKWVGNIS